MSKADVMAGRAYVSLYAKNDVSKTLAKLKTELNDFGSSIMGIGAKVAGMGAAITGGFTAALVHFANVGSELNDMSARTGISTTALAELGYAAGMTGTEMTSLESGVKKMQKNLGGIGPESKKAHEALAAMGLTMDQISGLAPEDQFQAIAESIGAIEDPSQQAAAAMALFGGSGTDLLPMMKNIKELRAEARELGIAPSPESVAAADAIGDAIDRLKAVISATVFEIGAAIAPMAMEIMDGFLVAVKAVKKFVSENKALIVTAAKVGAVLMAAGGAIIAIGSAFVGAGMAIGAIMSAVSAFGAAFGVVMSVIGAIGSILMSLASPIGILAVALVAGAYAWTQFTQSGQEAVSGLMGFVNETFGGMLTSVTDTMGGIADAIKSGDLMLAGQIAMVGLRLVFTQALEGIHSLFGDTLGTMAGQLLDGDFAGAWSVLGSSILDSVATMTAGVVGLFTSAANAVANKWADTVNQISDYILESASQGGMMGWALEQVSGVNMQEEVARGQRIEAQRRAAGMKPDTGGDIVDSSQFNVTDGVKNRIAEITAAIDSKMAGMTDATGQGLADQTDGKGAAVSANIEALQAELAALRSQASTKLAEMNSGAAESGAGAGSGSAAGGGEGQRTAGKSSVASFSLGALAQMAGRGGIEGKQLAATEKAAKASEKQLEKTDVLIASVQGWGLHHA